jgi:hypothetical protein
MVAASDLEMATRVWVNTRFHIFDPGTIHPQGYLVFTLASRGTGVAADALSIIDDEAVVHDAGLLYDR